MILEWHLSLRLSLGFIRKILIFVRKHLSFYPKDVLFFYLNEEELIQEVHLIKYIGNEISKSISYKTKNKRGGGAKT